MTLGRSAEPLVVNPRPERRVVRQRIHLAMLTYNALAHTQRAIASLFASTDVPFDLFVVDNSSSDDTRAWLLALEDDRIHLRFAERNLGVPGGRNALLRAILPHCEDDSFLVFVDNDLEFRPGWSEPFLRLFATRPEAGIASKQGSHVIVHRDRRQLLPTPNSTAPVDVASGGYACWIRASTARAVGEFDENLGLFWQEDDDYSIRAAALGHEVFAVPEAAVLHHEHASGVALDNLREGGCTRNAAYLAHKWRLLGSVDEDGWVVHAAREHYLPVAERRLIEKRLVRRVPFLRCEFARAQWDLARALASEDPVALVTKWQRAVGPLHHALLDHRRENAAEAGDAALVMRCRELREIFAAIATPKRHRVTIHTPERTPAKPLPAKYSRIASTASFADPAWRATAESVSQDPSGPSYHVATHENWALVQVLHGLASLGKVHPLARGLGVARGVDPLAKTFRERVAHLETRSVPTGSPLLPERATDVHDFVYLLGGVASGPNEARSLLRDVLPTLRSDGVLAIADTFDVSVLAAREGRAPAAVHAFLVDQCGLESLETPELTLTDETLAAATVRDGRNLDLPSCVHFEDGRTYSSCVFFYRKAKR